MKKLRQSLIVWCRHTRRVAGILRQVGHTADNHYRLDSSNLYPGKTDNLKGK